jgi:hypothetical protein
MFENKLKFDAVAAAVKNVMEVAAPVDKTKVNTKGKVTTDTLAGPAQISAKDADNQHTAYKVALKSEEKEDDEKEKEYPKGHPFAKDYKSQSGDDSKFDKKKVSTGTVYSRKADKEKQEEQTSFTSKLIEAWKMKEELKGKQEKLDMNKNGKLDKMDFKMLRAKGKKAVKEEVDFESLTEEQCDEMINEVLGKDAKASDWIHDFVHSDNPKFAGKSKEQRKKQALAAYYAKQRNEEVEQIDETAQLDQFIRSRGRDPEKMSKDEKVAFSKTNNYAQWAKTHG